MTASEDKFTRQILSDVHVWSPSLFSLRCSRDSGARFRAGQFARLGVQTADAVEPGLDAGLRVLLSKRTVRPPRRAEGRRQCGLARLFDGVGAA